MKFLLIKSWIWIAFNNVLTDKQLDTLVDATNEPGEGIL